jgi:hypothetical protein
VGGGTGAAAGAFPGLFALAFLFLAAGHGAGAAVTTAPRRDLHFEVRNEARQAPAVARVEVETLYAAPKTRGLFWLPRFKTAPRLVADGVNVHLETLELSALSRVPEKIREKSDGKNFEMRHLRLFAPGDTVPRLIAREVRFKSDHVWTLRNVLLAGKPSITSCNLHMLPHPGPQLFPRNGKSLSLKDLLSE